MENLLCFWCLENLPVPHIERLLTSKFIVNSLLLVLNIFNKIGFISFGVSLQKLFGFWGSAPGPARPGSRPDLPVADRTSSVRERIAILARISAPGRKFLTDRRTVRSPVRRRWTYSRTVRRAASNSHIFPTYKYPFFLIEPTMFLGLSLLHC
jgi:hypothetical protein